MPVGEEGVGSTQTKRGYVRIERRTYEHDILQCDGQGRVGRFVEESLTTDIHTNSGIHLLDE